MLKINNVNLLNSSLLPHSDTIKTKDVYAPKNRGLYFSFWKGGVPPFRKGGKSPFQFWIMKNISHVHGGTNYQVRIFVDERARTPAADLQLVRAECVRCPWLLA